MNIDQLQQDLSDVEKKEAEAEALRNKLENPLFDLIRLCGNRGNYMEEDFKITDMWVSSSSLEVSGEFVDSEGYAGSSTYGIPLTVVYSDDPLTAAKAYRETERAIAAQLSRQSIEKEIARLRAQLHKT